MSFSFLADALLVPGLLPVSLLTLGVILVNGWTDAPNAIATAVASKPFPSRLPLSSRRLVTCWAPFSPPFTSLP